MKLLKKDEFVLNAIYVYSADTEFNPIAEKINGILFFPFFGSEPVKQPCLVPKGL